MREKLVEWDRVTTTLMVSVVSKGRGEDKGAKTHSANFVYIYDYDGPRTWMASTIWDVL